MTATTTRTGQLATSLLWKIFLQQSHWRQEIGCLCRQMASEHGEVYCDTDFIIEKGKTFYFKKNNECSLCQNEAQMCQ